MGNTTTKSHYSKSLAGGGTSRRPRWEGSGLPAAPGKPILIPGADESQPDVVAIRWERSPSNGGSAIVGYLVEHRRLGSPHWVRSTPGLCTFPELTLSGLEPGWRYQFRVRAQNAIGLSRPSEISDPLTVTLQRSAASAPYFELELKDTVVLENEQAEFVVRFTGTPLPKISWFKDGFEIFSSRRTRIITDSGRSVLLIHQTALNDEGEIKCTATNRAGHASTKSRLVLEAPPKIRLPRQYEDGLLFEQDETIRLKVSLAGRPSPIVFWYHDGDLIPNDERHIFETMDGESVLKIPDAKRVDRGEYTVKAVNKLGEDSTSFLVTVTDRPAAPGKATVTMTLGRSVTLSWKEPDDDGGCKIGTYIVEYYRVGWDVWLKAITSRQTKVTLTELIEGSEYKFRVKAENPYGVSEPSEESDVIFIPDLKRGIMTPSLSGKSQSHREIRSREKREVSFAVPTQRTRSLTREEARTRDEDMDFGPSSRSVSAQRLSRPSRADSRVTFALDTLEKPNEAPVPPARSKDHSTSKHESRVENHVDRSSINMDVTTNENQSLNKESPADLRPASAVAVSPPIIDESSKRSAYRESRSRSVSMTRERSMSPLSMPKIQENYEEEASTRPPRLQRPSISLTLTKQQAIIDDPESSFVKSNSLDDKPGSPTTPREDDETVMHGSSEFMLVLYPDDEDQAKKLMDFADKGKSLEDEMTGEETEDMEDLIPPPMSLSLPELFSAEHQVVETLREAVSSTELLHERAMERFYRAVAAEEASDLAKRKTQLERTTGELASTVEGNVDIDTEAQDVRMRRRLSNPSVATQNLISWQTKKNRRRSSEGQTEGIKAPLRIVTPSLLSTVEARSDPYLSNEAEIATGKVEDTATQLRRWHENSYVPLVEAGESIPSKEEALTKIQPILQATEKQQEVEEEVEESIESSEESSEEMSSADSEDIKLLKARILARQVLEEEDTYHPRGKPVLHVETDPPPIPPHRIPILDVTPPTPTKETTMSLPNVVPKSILKKPKEEPIPVNSFGRPIPPEKPIRKIPPQISPANKKEEDERQPEIAPEPVRTPVLSESDTDSVLSAGEAAKNRRIQAKMRSATPEEEVDEEDIEARMAVVNHYTEIVREHSSHLSYRSSEERKFGDSLASSRRSSFSEDPDTKDYANKSRLETRSSRKQQQQEARRTEQNQRTARVKKEREVEKQEGKRSVGSRGTTPAREKRSSRTPSRNESPAPRSRNVSVERGVSSRSSSRTRARAPSQDRRPPSRTGSEDQRFVRDRSVDEGTRRSRKPSSTTHSRSSSRDRNRPETPVGLKMERLQKALESKKSKYRPLRRESPDEPAQSRLNGEQLALEAKKNVRFTVGYVTDLTLLMAAIYVYFFKKETLAIPFIALLLYRRIQHEICGRVSRGWWWSKRKQ
ncbi:muscle M-line assembly protein unc-89 isoform X2 [Colletes gigas]|uniref:muscle M-line assembly protein unc-89 isoform X2 n=1 Tax=Colletes gigas TaxID=935657 RepID=UPI001C9ABE12|nr:muscle M-line assembly protein unc-89 isoform X2 [Colletes gigas]